VERTRCHLLTDIITIAILAVIAGAQGWEDIEEYGLNKRVVVDLELPFGIPAQIRLEEYSRKSTQRI